MISEIVDRSNGIELEKVHRSVCLSYENNPSADNPSFIHTQDNLNIYHQKASLYSISSKKSKKYLFIYNTEYENEEKIKLKTPVQLNWSTSITQLPNGKLFCLNSLSNAYLITKNGEVEAIPSLRPCELSSVIYFNKNIYCFGGRAKNYKYITRAARFDLEFNQWNFLTPLPWADYNCNSIILNRDILISGNLTGCLLLYSIDLDSYSTVSYEFRANLTKILFNAGARLYLIECKDGWRCESEIYESEVENYTVWNAITKSKIEHNLVMSYWTYNKGAIYIGYIGSNYHSPKYYKFNLHEKSLTEAPINNCL